MKIIKKSPKKTARKSKDKQKEQAYRALSKVLEASGYTVRREKLKQGYGWKVQSGTCKAFEQQLIFVDSRMSQDDQLAFLVSKIVNAGLKLSADDMAELPESYAQELHKEIAAAA